MESRYDGAARERRAESAAVHPAGKGDPLRFLITIVFLAVSGCSFDPGAPPNETEQLTDAGTLDAAIDTGRTDGGRIDAGGDDAGDGGTSELCPVDGDGDGFGIGPDCPEAQADCDDENVDRFPGATESCNAIDDDCNGVTDDGCDCVDGQTRACGSDVGACQAGTQTCTDGAFGPCLGALEPGEETCNDIDDNCDGTTDEGCQCVTGDIRACGESTGACQPGQQRCDAGAWGACLGATGPQPETCNGIDDDCDGATDEDVTDLGGACATGIPGRCAQGIEACSGGQVVCQATETPTAEICNGRDDNCDGNVDENVSRACNSACGAGTEICSAGTWGTCTPTAPPPETCDGIDNDCDGETDEDVAEVGQRCDTGALGPCGEGTFSCDQGALKCIAAVGPQPETCDGDDNDCDGDTDEDANGLLLTENCGACPAGTRICQNGVWSSCDINNFEVCDGTDSNCDGAVDNDTACFVACGDRSAIGTLSCGGVTTCTPPAEICGDGIDNDCDGTIDQNCGTDLDGMVFIPAGRFIMGSDTQVDLLAANDEVPQRTIALSPYYIDRTEVTRADYARCITFGGCSLLRTGCPLQLTQQTDPVGCVTWDQAVSYCSWVGKRLPTEAEWERAARGGWDRDVLYPWGNSQTAANAVFNCPNGLVSCTEPADSFPQGASDDGLLHMSGNVAEWVSDFYDASYYAGMPATNPEQTVNQGFGHVIRGGSYSQTIEFGRVSNRAQPAFFTSAAEIGFRCAKDAP